MGKQKTKGQRRLMARKQKRNKAQKATNLRETLFRDFSDMTPMPVYMLSRLKKFKAAGKRIKAMNVQREKIRIQALAVAKILKEAKEAKHEILFRKFS